MRWSTTHTNVEAKDNILLLLTPGGQIVTAANLILSQTGNILDNISSYSRVEGLHLRLGFTQI
jgi:hypothetical protein